MNVMFRLSAVLWAAILIATNPVHAQSNPANPASANQNATVQINAQKDFTNEITGVIGDPGQIPAEKKKSSEMWGKAKKVQFYMTSWCPYCKRMEQFLKSADIPFEKIDIERDAEGKKAYKKLMARGIPVLVVDQTVIRGYDPAAVQAAWDEWNS